MRRIAVLNQKGGVGKTTTAANLGAALARRGLRVLLIDLDPQAHLSLHFGVEISDEQPSIYDVLTDSTPLDDVLLKVSENVTMAPADIDLAGAEAELVSVTGREVLLREALERWNGAYDVLLIDCPPSLGVLTVNALAAAREVLIPLQAHFLALQGLSRLLSTVTLVRQRINPALTVNGIVLCMHDASTRLASEVVDDLAAFLEAARDTDTPWSGARLYNTRIRRNIKLAESSSFGQTVFEYAPRSNGAIDYQNLAAELAGVDKPTVPAPDTDASAVSRPLPHDTDATPPVVEMTVAAPGPSADTAGGDDLPGDATTARWRGHPSDLDRDESDPVTTTS
ncbi:MAG: AAA family ATPase [Phycisphaerae bacterium]|jgi:chromosome partitioning protein